MAISLRPLFWYLIVSLIIKTIASFHPVSCMRTFSLHLSRSNFMIPLNRWLWPLRESCACTTNMLLSGTRERYKPVGLMTKSFFCTDGNKKWKCNTGGLFGSRTFNLEMGNNSAWVSSIRPRSTIPDARVIFASQMEAQRNRKKSSTNQTSPSSKVRSYTYY